MDAVTLAAANAAAKKRFTPRLPQRILPLANMLPSIMATPPTIAGLTVGAPGSTPSMASGVFKSAVSPSPGAANGTATPNPLFTYRGGTPSLNGGNFYVLPLHPAPAASPTMSISLPYSVEFDYYGTAFDYMYKGQGTLVTRVWVDGQYAEAPFTGDGTQDGFQHKRTVTFSTAAWRRIRLDLSAPFYGVNIGPTDTIVPVSPSSERLLVIGDSYGQGTGSTSSSFSGFAFTLGLMLGFRDTWSYSAGGTGLTLANGTAPKYRDRSDTWASANATAVLIQNSINDDSTAIATVQSELAQVIAICKALPTVKDVWVMGPAARGGGDIPAKQPRDVALASTAATAGVPYVSLVNPALWSGTGKVGSLTGSGNSDVMMVADGAHPTQAGHDMIARAVAHGISATRPAA